MKTGTQRQLAAIPGLILVLWCCAGDAREARAGEAASPAIMQEDDVIPLAGILGKGGEYSGKIVVVEGAYRGWKGKCSSSFTLTGGDWILEDKTGCIYITGMSPPGLSPARPGAERILVRGTVTVNKKGKPIIKASRLIRRIE